MVGYNARMRLESRESLIDTAIVRVNEVRCHRSHQGAGCEEFKAEHQITIPLSGVNVKHVAGQSLLVSSMRATLSNRGEPYRISHPNGFGETALNIALRDDLLFDLLSCRRPEVENRLDRPFASQQIPIDSRLHFAARIIASLAKAESATAADLQEATIHFADRLINGTDAATTHQAVTSRERQLAHDAQIAMARCFSLPVTLEQIAAALDISVFHLCRTFKRVTGRTLWSEIQQLRVREALQLLASGRDNLTEIALSLGYAHHSHFTLAFRRATGITPSTATRIFRFGSIRQAHEILRH